MLALDFFRTAFETNQGIEEGGPRPAAQAHPVS